MAFSCGCATAAVPAVSVAATAEKGGNVNGAATAAAVTRAKTFFSGAALRGGPACSTSPARAIRQHGGGPWAQAVSDTIQTAVDLNTNGPLYSSGKTLVAPTPNGFQSRYKDDEPRQDSDILVEALEREGVRTVVAYPGGASMEIHQALTCSERLRNVLCRHEQGEIFAAEGYAKSSGRVCIATSGPGATNLVTGLADALVDSEPLVAITVSERSQKDLLSQSPGIIPVLSLTEVASRLQEFSLRNAKPYAAMYSSVVEGITLDPAAMIVPLDDHMVHRGHAVFDTATIFAGHLYELDAHLDRLLRSASKAKLKPPFQRSFLRDILVQTVAASGCHEGSLRYWLSAGPGGFGLSPTECEKGSFYAVVIRERHGGPVDGVKVITSSIPIKPPQFATMKTTNYLPNAQVIMEAEEKGAFQGIWLDQEGFVAEAANMNVAFVSKGELLLPSFANILSGCTVKRLVVLAQQLTSKQGSNNGILKGIKEAKITVEEGKSADEMMLVVSNYLVIPVLEWDGQPIGKGTVGPVTRALLSLLQKDVLEGPPEVREPVPYKG